MWKNVRGIPLNGIEFAYRDCLIMFGIFDTMWLWRFNEIQCQRNQETDANSACHCSFWKFLGLWSKLNRILSSSDAGTCITSRANQTLQTLAHPEQGTKEPCGECTPGRAQQLLWLAIRLESLALSARRHQHEKWTGHGKARHQAHPSARELDDQSQQPALPRRQRTQGLHARPDALTTPLVGDSLGISGSSKFEILTSKFKGFTILFEVVFHQHEKWTGPWKKLRHQAHPSAWARFNDQSQQPALPRRQKKLKF